MLGLEDRWSETESPSASRLLHDWGGSRILARTVIDPVGNQGAKSNNTAFNADEKTAVGGLGAFGLVGWDRGGVDAVTHAGDGAADEELSKRGGSSLAGNLDNHA